MGPYYDFLATMVGAPERRESRPSKSRGATPGTPFSSPRIRSMKRGWQTYLRVLRLS